MPEMLKIVDSRSDKIVKLVVDLPEHFELRDGTYVNKYREYELITPQIT